MAQNDTEIALRIRAAIEGAQSLEALVDELEEFGAGADESASQARTLADEAKTLAQRLQLVDTFRRLKTEVAGTGDALETAQRDAQELGRQMSQTEKPTRALSDQFNRARAEVTRLKNEQQEQTVALQRVRQALNGAGVDTRELSEAERQTRAELDRANKELAEHEARLKGVRDDLARGTEAANGFTSGIKRMAAGLAATVGAYVGLQSIKNGIQAILSTGGQFEAYAAQFEQLMGSAEEGERAFAWVQEFAKRTPMELEGVTEAFTRLKAFGLDPMDGTLEAIVNQTAALGGGQQELEGIVLALGQAWAKQKLQGEEILQLVERGVPVWDLLAQATGKNVQELQELSSAGELGRDTIKALIDEIGRSTDGAIERQMSTWNGLVSNLRDNWTQFLDTVARSGVLDWFKDQLSAVNAEIAAMAADGRLQRYAQQISDAIVGAGQAIKGMVATLYEWRDALLTAGKALAAIQVAKLAGGLLTLAANLKTTATGLIATAKEASATTGKLNALRAAALRIPTSIKIGIAVVGFEAAKAAGEWLGETLGKHSAAAEHLAQTQERLRREAWAGIEAAKEQAAAYEEFRTVALKTGEEVARMSELERAEYKQKLEGLRQYLAAQTRLALLTEQLGSDTQEWQQKNAAAWKEFRAALAALEDGGRSAAASIEGTVDPAVEALIEQFREARDAGEDTEKALSSLFQNFDPGNFGGVQTLLTTLDELVERGELSAETLREHLGGALDNLSADQLQRFQITAQAAMGGVAEESAALAAAIDSSIGASLRALGVDVVQMETGISAAGAEAIKHFDNIAGSGKASAEQIAAAYMAAYEQMKTEAGRQALDKALERTGEAGKQAMAIIREEMAKLADDAEKTGRSIATELTSGIGSASTFEAIRQIRDELRQAFLEGKLSVEEYDEALVALEQRQAEIRTDLAETQAAADKVFDGLIDEIRNLTSTDSGSVTALKRQIEDAFDSGQISAEQFKDSMKALELKLQALERRAGGVGQAIGAMLNNITSSLAAMSTATANYFRDLMGLSRLAGNDLEAMQGRLESVNQRIAENRTKIMNLAGGIGTYFEKMAEAGYKAEQAFLEQAIAAETLRQRVEGGRLSVEELERAAYRAERGFDLLDQQQLSGLRSAIAAAQRDAQQLTQSLEQQVSSLRDELDQLRGDEEAIERRRYERQRRELQEQLELAQAQGNREAAQEAQEALRLLQQIQSERREQQQIQQAQQRQPPAQSQAASTPEPARAAPPTQRLEFVAPSGRVVAGEFTEDNAAQMVELLAEAGMRTV